MTDPPQSSEGPAWLDEEHPHDEAHALAQIKGVQSLLGGGRRRVLDLGCGVGRVLVPLARSGHELVGIDRDPETLAKCRAALERHGLAAELLEADFCEVESLPAGPFDAALCLGNTLMTIVDVDQAVSLLAAINARLGAGGMLIVDDCPGDFWPELTAANWQSGISEDGSTQLLWDDTDAIFTIRTGAAVDPESWTRGEGDRAFRLWTDGALRLAARNAGLSGPERHTSERLLVMHRA